MLMWWAFYCVTVMACSSLAVAAPAPDSLTPLDLVQIDPSTADDESLGYAVQPMGGQFAAGAPWLYLLADMPRDSQRLAELHEGRARPKRKMPTLSINNPMEVLRQRLLLEVARKQMREANQRQAMANRVFLQNVGKRDRMKHSGIMLPFHAGEWYFPGRAGPFSWNPKGHSVALPLKLACFWANPAPARYDN